MDREYCQTPSADEHSSSNATSTDPYKTWFPWRLYSKSSILLTLCQPFRQRVVAIRGFTITIVHANYMVIALAPILLGGRGYNTMLRYIYMYIIIRISSQRSRCNSVSGQEVKACFSVRSRGQEQKSARSKSWPRSRVEVQSPMWCPPLVISPL